MRAGGDYMKEDVCIKLVIYKKGTPRKKVMEQMSAVKTVWEELYPGKPMICIPVGGDPVSLVQKII